MGSEPRRRHSPAVYRRRRIAVLLLALLVTAGIVWLVIAQPWRGLAEMLAQPEPAQTAAAPVVTPVPSSPAPTPTPSPTPSSTEPPTPQPCDPEVIDLEPVVYGEIFETKPVQLGMRLTNTGPVPCTMDVGTSKQEFVITSGSDRWWRSTDCQSEPSDMVVTLAAGQTVESAEPLVWDRTRSDVGTCASENRPRAPGGDASYRLTVRIGDIKSDGDVRFFLR
ncbi:hypothetical protein [Microbacterium sp. NPDC096154]|uniref:hypothetical protein n=1 Tax=Microbacterium sp. NPDC096154 TaxID=3155549 RepID=UPI003332297C